MCILLYNACFLIPTPPFSCITPQARAFSSRDAVQDFLYNNPEFMIAAVHFVFDGLSDNSSLSNFDNITSIQEGIEQLLPPGVDLPPSATNFTFPPIPEEIAESIPPDVVDQVEEGLSQINNTQTG